MLVLGYSGGMDLVYQNRWSLFPPGWLHDSAVALVDNGKVVAAIEEERLNRIKHTNKAAVNALRFCLDSYRVRLSDVDRLVIAGGENFLNKASRRADLLRTSAEPLTKPRELVHELLRQELGEDINDQKLIFMPHHMAHAVSVYAVSGFNNSLIFTADGGGDDIAGMVAEAEGADIRVLAKTPLGKALGSFYLSVISYIGFGLFEEYKVMGLAPYGDPATYRDLFKNMYELLPEGDYLVYPDLPDGLAKAGPPRKKKDPITQAHKDIAAALQEALEEIAFHILSHYQKQTGQTKLCLSGGVAHNCSMNGKILYSGLFKEIFVQPAAHDGGLALGAALFPFLKDLTGSAASSFQLDHLYWGTPAGSNQAIAATLNRWKSLIEFKQPDNIAQTGAELLAEGAVIGFVQGRSEFGPRALGNRSIVADPRPAENKDLINAMVKKREGYRPFAPSVMEEYAQEYFDLPDHQTKFPFMTFVVKLREDKKDILKATTHVDGTARIQTVSKQTNKKFWELIDAFRRLTGVPALLNTSFNNNVEPIVDSVDDAIVCFLTTKLNYLIAGDYLVSKRAIDHSPYFEMIVSLPLYARLAQTRRFVSNNKMAVFHVIANASAEMPGTQLSKELYAVLLRADGKKTVRELFAAAAIDDEARRLSLVEELLNLWSLREVILKPV